MSAAPPGYRLLEGQSPFIVTVGPIYGKREDGEWRLAFRAEEKHANYHGVVHGGMLMTLADQMFGLVAWLATDRKRIATVSLHNEFLAPARPGDWIEARAEITRRTGSLVFVRGALNNGETRLLTASGIWKIRERG